MTSEQQALAEALRAEEAGDVPALAHYLKQAFVLGHLRQLPFKEQSAVDLFRFFHADRPVVITKEVSGFVDSTMGDL